jgi:F1F0 ATPase subunit 2
MFDTNELPFLAAAAGAGLLLGGLYFAGLWWTVQRMRVAGSPFNLYFGSLIARLVLVLAAFYGILTIGGWTQLLASLFGFVVARLLLIWLVGLTLADAVQQQEAR